MPQFKQLNNNQTTLRGPVPLTHLMAFNFIKPGDYAVDATCGNGKDTLVLARLVGNNGHVWGFDVQIEALERTGERLKAEGLEQRVTLHNCGHELLATYIGKPVAMVIFNLGWLPGGDRSIITSSSTTIPALKAGLQLLKSNGLLIITCYPGHSGGDQETDNVLSWAEQLPPQQYHVWRMGQINVSSNAPFCLIIQSCGKKDE